MAKLTNISGFPEWLPQQKLLEQKLIERIRAVYESHGFVPIETRAVEPLSILLAKGVGEKELYAIQRVHAEEGEKAELGLHFDLTVPFARYVAEHFNDIVFPFRRYQLQKVWRGERPQKGRFREFLQFDVDIVARDRLPISCDAEVVTVLDKVIASLCLGKYVVRINNRKLLLGIYESLGLSGEKRSAAITVIDKLEKIGEIGVLRELCGEVGLAQAQAEEILRYCKISFPAEGLLDNLNGLQIDSDQFRTGAEELGLLISLLPKTTQENIQVCLNLARGLDYYTGLIVEVHLDNHPDFGSVAGGGRYEGLVSQFIKKNVPGVGISIGLTRLMDLIIRNNLVPGDAEAIDDLLILTEVLVSVYNEDQRVQCNEIAEQLRSLDISTEVSVTSPKLGKQIDYASKKGIPYVLFVDEESGELAIKDIRSGEQEAISDLKELKARISY